MSQPFQPSNFTLLAADDDPVILELIRLYLTNKGFQLLTAGNGKEALALLHKHTVHLVVLDVMMPEMDGWQLCQAIRESSDIPILMLTAKGESEDKLQGFGFGADDYIVKPFDPNELVARVTSLLRRTYASLRQIKLPASLQFGRLCIQTASHTVSIENELVEVTPKEYKLLLTLAQHVNQVLDRQQLLDLVWGDDYVGEDRVVDVTVKRLRQKLLDDAASWKIETVRGTGYKFITESGAV